MVTVRLEDGTTTLVLDLEHGGRVASLEVDGCALLVEHAHDALDWGCYVMAPYAGRVRDGRVTFDGRSHQLPRRGGPHALHGTVLDVAWERVGDTRLRAALGPAWPWPGVVEQDVRLDPDGVTFHLTVRALDGPMPATAGWHPWFRRRVGRGGELELDVRPVAAWELDPELLPTGRLVAPPPPPWDTPFDGLHAPPRLTWPGALALELTSSCTTWVVYSQPEHAVCVEPQTARPDALASDEVVVTPDEPLHAWMRWSWSSG